MATERISVTQEEPVLFRVEQVTSNPYPALFPSSDVLVHIERLNPYRRPVYGIPIDRLKANRIGRIRAAENDEIFLRQRSLEICGQWCPSWSVRAGPLSVR